MSNEGQNQGTPPGGDGGNGGDAKWYSGIPDADVRGFIETKGWDGPDAVVKSYRQLESHMGVPADRLLKLPGEANDPAWKEVRAKVGFAVPDKAEDYGLQIPEGIDPGFANKVAAKALELGIPKHMLQGLAEFQNVEMAEAIKAQEQAMLDQSNADMAALRAEWGERADESIELARRAVTEFGSFAKLDAEALNEMEGAMGTAAFLKLWAAIGSKTGEAKFVDAGDAGTQRGVMSPDAARVRIEALKGDKAWFERWSKGDAQAIAEWNNLNKIAAGAK